MARPMLPEAQRRSVMVIGMMRPAEKTRLMQRAEQLDVSGSSLVRSAVLALLDKGPAARPTPKEAG